MSFALAKQNLTVISKATKKIGQETMQTQF